MITPTKFTSFRASLLSRVPRILQALQEPVHIAELHKMTSKHFTDVDEFLSVLTLLYVTSLADVDLETGMVSPC